VGGISTSLAFKMSMPGFSFFGSCENRKSEQRWRGFRGSFITLSPHLLISASDFLESDLADMIVEADLELIEDAFAAKNIEANSKTFRKSNGRHDLKFSNVEFEIMKIGRNETPISDHNHLECAILNVDSHTPCRSFMEDTKHRSGVNINPHLFFMNGNRNDWH